MSDLHDLAVRVEQATGPSRELDAEIERVLPPTDPRSDLPSLWNERAARFHGARIGEYDSEDYVPAAYTASVDSAMTLAAGFGGEITFFKDGTAKAFLWQPYPLAIEAKAATPALALAAAALRARSTMEKHDG